MEGVYVVPNPFDHNYLYYMKLDIEVSLYGIFWVNLIMIVNDKKSIWECFAELFLIDVGLELVGSSRWIGLDSLSDIGSLLQVHKSFSRFKIRFGRMAKRLIEKINEKIKAIGQFLKETWGTIVKDVGKIRDQVTDLTAFLCRSPPCILSTMLGSMAAIVAGPLVAGANFLINLFGKKKTSIVQIGIDEFKCPIWKRTTKKCIWRIC